MVPAFDGTLVAHGQLRVGRPHFAVTAAGSAAASATLAKVALASASAAIAHLPFVKVRNLARGRSSRAAVGNDLL